MAAQNGFGVAQSGWTAAQDGFDAAQSGKTVARKRFMQSQRIFGVFDRFWLNSWERPSFRAQAAKKRKSRVGSPLPAANVDITACWGARPAIPGQPQYPPNLGWTSLFEGLRVQSEGRPHDERMQHLPVRCKITIGKKSRPDKAK
jgi:hypothetical protein